MIGPEFGGLSRDRKSTGHDDCGCGGSFRPFLIHIDERLVDHRRDEQLPFAVHTREIGSAKGQKHAHRLESIVQAELRGQLESRQEDSDWLLSHIHQPSAKVLGGQPGFEIR